MDITEINYKEVCNILTDAFKIHCILKKKKHNLKYKDNNMIIKFVVTLIEVLKQFSENPLFYKKEDLLVIAELCSKLSILKDADFDVNTLTIKKQIPEIVPSLNLEEGLLIFRIIGYSCNMLVSGDIFHTFKTESISSRISELLEMSELEKFIVSSSSLLHDIGKVGIPSSILLKQGILDNNEFETIKKHSLITYMLLTNRGIDDIRDIASRHHEKLDGSGYFGGYDRNVITLENRILTLSDILSALLEKRCYKEAFSKDKIIRILKDLSGDKLDENLCKLVISEFDFVTN